MGGLTTPSTPSSRIRPLNNTRIDENASFVLYWMTAARRTRCNFGLQRAVELANQLRKPLVILEALRVDYPHASDRLHAFVLQGMADNAKAIARSRAAYYAYVEPRVGAARGLLDALSAHAAAVVTDWFPAFFLPRMTAAAAATCRVRLEAVDGNGLIPVADHGRPFPTARGYRGFVQSELRRHLESFAVEDPLALLGRRRGAVPAPILKRWPAHDTTQDVTAALARLPIDHAVHAVGTRGGSSAAAGTLDRFLESRIDLYHQRGNHPDDEGTSRLSPYLHFGHIGAHEIFSAVMTRERWTTRKIGKIRKGSREGWWNVGPGAEHFLEQLVVWRELAFNGCAWLPGYASYETLPVWARASLDAHLGDQREHLYSLADLDQARTDDRVWNAAQNELRQTGWFHGYMRMVWGKKMLEWCAHPREALAWMEALMNRYSLDGRDPVSYLNYGWVLGRYDRPWFERPIFGVVRYMTTESARRKLRMKGYLETYG